MATNDIGRVTPIWRGFYSAATTYELNDIVIDTAGSVWWHKSEEQTTGVTPAVGDFWDAVIDMSIFSGLIQTAIVTAQTAVQAAQAAETGVAEDVQRAETAAGNAETYAQNAQTSAANVGAYAQAAEAAKNAAAGSAESAGSSATAAAGSKSDAEAYAVGKRGGTDVGVDDPTYHNNAKYYADQAGSSAEAAAGSKSDAEAYAVGKRGGEDVGSEDPAYHNNAKYWSEQAEATAEDIEDSSAQIAQNAADVADLKTQLKWDEGVYDGYVDNIANFSEPSLYDDGYFLAASGSITPLSGYSTSKLIPVGDIRYLSLCGSTKPTIAAYDADGVPCETRVVLEHISGSIASNTFSLYTLPSDCVYIRIGVSTTYISRIVLSAGKYNALYTQENNPDGYTAPAYRERQNLNKSIIVDGKQVLNQNLDIRVAKNAPVYNIIDFSQAIKPGAIDNASGGVFEATGLYHTDYIPVEPNTHYYVGGGMYTANNYAFYDKNYSLVTGVTITDGEFTTPDNVYFLRLTHISNRLTPERNYISKYGKHYYPAGYHCDPISPFVGKSVLVFGDSITTGSSSVRAINAASYGNYEKWVDMLISEGYFSYDTTRNDSMHATGFVKKTPYASGGFWLNGENNFVQRLQYYIDENLCDNYDVVIVFGGINDYISNIPLGTALDDAGEYFIPAVNAFFDKLINNFTHAKTFVILPFRTPRAEGDGEGVNTSGISFNSYYNHIRDTAKIYSIPCFDGGFGSHFCPAVNAFKNMWTYTADGVHPNGDFQEEFMLPMFKGFLSNH